MLFRGGSLIIMVGSLFLVACQQGEPQVVTSKARGMASLTCGEDLLLSYPNVRPVIESRCLRCHQSGTRHSLASLSDIQRVKEIAHEQVEADLMPEDSALEPNQKKLLTAWLALGAPETSSVALACDETLPDLPGPTLPPTPPTGPDATGPTDPQLPPTGPVTYQLLREKILEPKCLQCHTSSGDAFLYDFSSAENMAFIPGIFDLAEPEKSLIVLAVERVGRGQMPPQRSQIPRLTPQEVSLMKEWIRQGLKP